MQAVCNLSSRLLSHVRVPAITKSNESMATTQAPAAKNSSLLSFSATSRQANRLTKQLIKCPICTEEVVDSVGHKKGHESIFCDGRCQEWVHRQCAGLSKVAFQAVSNSDNQFHCPHCVIIQQSEDISALSATVSVISRDIKALQEKLANITYNGLQYAKSTPEVSLQPSAPGPNKPPSQW